MKTKINKLFKSLYIINLIIILIALLYPLGVKLLVYPKTTFSVLLLQYYGVVILLSLSFCITFLLINIWGFIIHKTNRLPYVITTTVLLIWIIWGIIRYNYGIVP